MKFHYVLFVFILVCVICLVGLVTVAKSEDYAWKDGFLEKNYSESIKDVNSAITLLLGVASESETQNEDSGWHRATCIAVGVKKLEGENGFINQWGVGDKNGKWGMWAGVGTIEGLDIKEGGSIVSVKVIEKDGITIVGFKVDEEDRKASEKLHELMLQKLKK